MICSTTSYGASLQDLLNKQSKIDKQMDSMQDNINKIEQQKDTIENQIDAINQKIAKVQTSLTEVNLKLYKNELKISGINKEINDLTKKQDEQKKKLQTRLKAYYENDTTTYLDIIFGSQNLTELITRLDIIKQIAEMDNIIITQIEESKKTLDQKKAEFEAVKNEIMVSKSAMDAIKNEHLKAKQEKDALVSKLTAEQRRIEREFEILEEQSNNIERQIQKYQAGKGDTKYVGGILTWPAPGYTTITSSYGMRFHPILKTNKMHTGIDLGVPSGSTVVAGGDGTVISSSYMSGYGNTVIIDHGGGVSSLYAHNSSLLVSAGQKVKKGQTIAKSGSTGNSTGPHVHFEVRVNGSTVNPLSYLK